VAFEEEVKIAWPERSFFRRCGGLAGWLLWEGGTFSERDHSGFWALICARSFGSPRDGFWERIVVAAETTPVSVGVPMGDALGGEVVEKIGGLEGISGYGNQKLARPHLRMRFAASY
jgi:hypothetical protein